MPNYVVSLIRTLAPMLAGWLLALPLGPQIVAALGITDTTKVAGLIGVGLAFAYYAVVRALEARWPALGALLGHPAKPVYDAATGTWTTADLAWALNDADQFIDLPVLLGSASMNKVLNTSATASTVVINNPASETASTSSALAQPG